MVGVEVLLAGVQPGDLGLDAGELGLRAGGPLAGLLQRRGQPADLGLAGLDLAAPRGRPGRPAGPVPRGGRRPPGRRRPPAAARRSATPRPPAGPRRRRPSASRSRTTAASISRSSARTCSASASSWSGSRPGALVLRLAREVPDPLGGQAAGAAEPLAQRRQAVPGLLRPGQGRRLGGGGLLERGLPLGRLGQGGLDLGPAGAQRGLVGHLGLEGRGELPPGRRPGSAAASPAGRTGSPRPAGRPPPAGPAA